MMPQDVDAVAKMEQAIFSSPWSAQGFLDSLANPDTLFIVALEDDANIPAGYAGMYLALDEGEITNVAVAESCRRNGIGRALIREILQMAAARGIRRVVLEVRVSNRAAIALYEQMGFRRIGTRRGFYDFPKEDADIMEWNDGKS
jgi:ribosomal-protein-alanine N-acetyltransferase